MTLYLPRLGLHALHGVIFDSIMAHWQPCILQWPKIKVTAIVMECLIGRC